MTMEGCLLFNTDLFEFGVFPFLLRECRNAYAMLLSYAIRQLNSAA